MAILVPPGGLPSVTDDDRLRADSERAQAQLQAQERAGTQVQAQQPPDVGLGAMDLYGGLATQQANRAAEAEAILNANPVRYVQEDNPLRPVVEQGARDFRGAGGAVQQGRIDKERLAQIEAVVPRGAGETDEQYVSRVDAIRLLGANDEEAARFLGTDNIERAIGMSDEEMAKVAQSNWDPREIGSQGMPGMAEAQRQVTEDVGQAEVAQAQGVADVKGQAVAQQQADTEAIASETNKAIEFQRQQVRAMQTLRDAEKAAREQMAAVPPPDSKRYVREMNGAQKFFAVLGAIAGGWAGSSKSLDTIQKSIDRDVEEQVMEYEQARDKYQATADAAGQNVDIIGRMIDTTNSIPASMELMKKLHYEDYLANLDAMIAETTVPVAKAELQKLRVGLEGAIREQDRQISLQLATTPEKIGRTVDPLGRRNRKRLEGIADTADARQWEATLLGAKSFADAEENRAKLEMEFMEKAEKSKRGEGGDYRLVRDFAKETADAQALYSSIQEYIEDFGRTDIAGRGGSRIADWSDPNERARAETRLQNIIDQLARSRSGAALTEDEIEMYKDLLQAGIGDEQLLDNMRMISQSTYSHMVPLWDTLPDSAQAFYEERSQKDPSRARMIAQLKSGARSDTRESSVVRKDSDEERSVLPEVNAALRAAGGDSVRADKDEGAPSGLTLGFGGL